MPSVPPVPVEPAPSAAPVVVARRLCKRFGPLVAVDGIDFEVGRGECVGFLGPNGAGKTTTVRMVTCASPVTSGEARVFGLDVSREPRRIKARLGVCPQEDNLDPDFSVRRNLLVYGRYFDLDRHLCQRRADELLELLALTDKADARVNELSGGMKRRLMLARALINEPELLVLDEPTTGLDPQARHLLWQRIRLLVSRGVTVLLTTHYMEEASQLCQRVLLLDGGRIVLEGRPAELVEREVGREVVELWDFPDEVRELVRAGGYVAEEAEGRLYAFDRQGGRLARLVAERFPGQQRLIRHATLEDVFLHRAGRTLKD